MWNKLGLLIKASNQYEFMYSHTAMPQALHLKNDLFRIYYGTRNKQNEPSIGFLEIDINCPNEVLYISDSPVLIKGQWGMFDDNGLYPGNIITVWTKNGKVLNKNEFIWQDAVIYSLMTDRFSNGNSTT